MAKLCMFLLAEIGMLYFTINKNLISLLTIIALSIFNGYVKVFNVIHLKSIARLLPVIGVLLIVFGLILYFVKKNKNVALIAILLLLLLFLSNIISNNIINNQYKKVFNDGTAIGTALCNYFKDNNIYPETLNELIPKYINKIPRINTTWDTGNFSYFTNANRRNYTLSFDGYEYDGKGWVQKP